MIKKLEEFSAFQKSVCADQLKVKIDGKLVFLNIHHTASVKKSASPKHQQRPTISDQQIRMRGEVSIVRMRGTMLIQVLGGHTGEK